MHNYNGNGSISTTDMPAFPSFGELIEKYLEPNAKEKGKYHCPICEGHNLSLGKNGKWDCYDDPTPEHRQKICFWLNTQYSRDNFGRELSGGNGAGNGASDRPRAKSKRQIAAEKKKEAEIVSTIATSEVELKAKELSLYLDPDYGITEAKLTNEMAAWAKAAGHDVYAAKMLLKDELKMAKSSGVGVTLTSSPTGSNPVAVSISETVGGVGDILGRKLPAFMEQHELEVLQSKSEMTKGGFWSLVSELRGKEDLCDEEEIQNLAKFAEWKATVFDLSEVLPAGLAQAMIRDAKALGIEAMMLWQYLFVAILSLLPKDAGLKMHSQITPAIAYTAIIAETGAGKTRAENLIMKPLIKMQVEAAEARKRELENYSREYKAATKDPDADADDIPKPEEEEKFLLTVATVQAVWSRLSSQTKHGTAWVRDELAGLFKSFGQFSKGGENESLELILQSWDGSTQFIDRMDEAKSFVLEDPRLSIAGGLQPAVYRQIFKDPEDSQGLAARFLMFHGKPTPVRDISRKTHLGESLPEIYQAIQRLKLGVVEPDEKAFELWNDARYSAEVEALDHPVGSVRAWLRKRSGHASRIALALHALECVYSIGKDRSVLTEDTMAKALKFAGFYRQQFEVIQAQSVEPNLISGYLTKIWDFANNKGQPVSVRDVLRNFSALNKIAEKEKRKPANLVLDLFAQLGEAGRGSIVEGRYPKFAASTGKSEKATDTTDTTDTIAESLTTAAVSGTAKNVGEGVSVTPTPEDSDANQSFPPSPANSPLAETNNPLADQNASFSIGDEVEIIGDSPYKGGVGKIEEIIQSNGSDPIYRVIRTSKDVPETNFEEWFLAADLKTYDWTSWRRF